MAVTIPSSNGVQLVLHDLGGKGPTVLLAHATGFHGRAYSPLAGHLQDFHVWAPDLRGHGDASPPRDLDFHWNGFAEDLERVIDGLAAEMPIFGLGHSMGAAALLLVEARRPGTFVAIYAFEPIVIPPRLPREPELQSRFVDGTRKRRASFASPQEAFENYASKSTFADFEEGSLRAYIEHGFQAVDDGSIHLKMEPDCEARVYLMNDSLPTYDRLPEIACPVTIARGRATTHGPAAWTDEVAARLPDGRTEVFEDLSHMGPFENPGRLAQHVRRFFGRAG